MRPPPEYSATSFLFRWLNHGSHPPWGPGLRECLAGVGRHSARSPRLATPPPSPHPAHPSFPLFFTRLSFAFQRSRSVRHALFHIILVPPAHLPPSITPAPSLRPLLPQQPPFPPNQIRLLFPFRGSISVILVKNKPVGIGGLFRMERGPTRSINTLPSASHLMRRPLAPAARS